MKLKVATTQFQLRPERTFEDFADHAQQIIGAVAGDGAEVVLLPELVTTGLLATHSEVERLTVRDLNAAYRTVFPAYTERFIHVMSELAAAHEIVIVAGSHYRRTPTGGYRNTAYVLHPDGRVEQQDKLHLIPEERLLGTEPGDDVLVTRIGSTKVAVQICADIEFPEVSRYLASQGVDLILVPSLTWNRRGAQRVRYGAHARSMENQIYVAVSTLVGTSGLPQDGAMYGTGNSFIAMPLEKRFGDNEGIAVAHPDDGVEGYVVGELDMERLAESRANPEPPGYRYRREDLYRRLTAGAH
ncbi:nitrilase-related carbon-nitrogen hydrolase [Microbacterium sp. X-17]|uniref:nitrilase-related carbon-nitrogen hydrolase n=1 Tax=Microbacterium sp. X-17 TaxID=3144404 RepID=UPI0031F53383